MRGKTRRNRYFIVFYQAINKDDSMTYGNRAYTTNGYYLVWKRIVKDIKEEDKIVKDAWITNIIELNKRDYKDWLTEAKETGKTDGS